MKLPKEADAAKVLSYIKDISDSFVTEETGYEFVDYSLKPYNPDPLVRKKGTLDVYRDMLDDEQVMAAYQIKKHMVVSNGYEITGDEDDDRKAFLEENFNNRTDRPFEEPMDDMLSFLAYGFMFGEPIYQLQEWEGKKLYFLRDIRVRAPHTFEIRTDEYGDIEDLIQYTNKGHLSVDHNRLIHLRGNSEFGNPYGRSDFKSAYKWWVFKQLTRKFWARGLERFGLPIPVVETPKSISETDRRKLETILKSFQNATAMIVPKGANLTMHETNHTGMGQAFEEAMSKCDLGIARALLIPDLLGLSGSKTSGGSYSLGDIQFSMFCIIVGRLRNYLERSINLRIIKPLISINFENQEDMPQFKLKPLGLNEAEVYAGLWKDAVSANAFKPNEAQIKHFLDLLNFPNEEVEEAEKKEPTFPPQFQVPGQNVEPQEDKQGEPKDSTNPVNEIENLELNERIDNAKGCGCGSHGPVVIKMAQSKFGKRVDFKKINGDFDKAEAAITQETVPILRNMAHDLIDAIKKKKIIERRDFAGIDALDVKFTNQLRTTLDRNQRQAYKESFKESKKEISSAKKTFAKEIDFDEWLLPPKEAFKYFKEQARVTSANLSSDMKKKTKSILLDSLASGDSVQTTVFKLEQLLLDLQENKSAPEWLGSRIETIARTMTSDAINQGRRASFEDPRLEGFVKAYEYNAVLDNRTTPVCESLDGTVYKVNDPALNKITPPLHFNCRSILLPIFEDEEFTPDDSAKILGGLEPASKADGENGFWKLKKETKEDEDAG